MTKSLRHAEVLDHVSSRAKTDLRLGNDLPDSATLRKVSVYNN